jgi:hypothetical protein
MIQGQKFPIRQEIRQMPDEEPEEKEIRTRSGYLPQECFRSLQTSLLESGTIATGRSLHFAADLVASGGLSVFLTLIWEFAIRHIGIASPRVFVYLQKRISELDEMCNKYADEDLVQLSEFQTRITELVFVVRDCPRRGKLSLPKIGVETQREGWLASVASADETQVLRKVFQHGMDHGPLRRVGAEFLKAISEGASEKALFWILWTLDQDHKARKEHGAGFTSADRGGSQLKGKAKNDVIFYFVDLCAESYKDYAGRSMIRMHEEFQCLINLMKQGNSHLGQRYRRDILFLCVQILCEVPRWKVPAAPPLIKDPVVMSRAITQSGSFFREVLANPKVSLHDKGKRLFKQGKISDTSKSKVKKKDEMMEQFDAYEKAMQAYLK